MSGIDKYSRLWKLCHVVASCSCPVFLVWLKCQGVFLLVILSYFLMSQNVFSSPALAFMEKNWNTNTLENTSYGCLKAISALPSVHASSLHSPFTVSSSSALQAAAINYSTGRSEKLLHLRRQITVGMETLPASLDMVQSDAG